MAKLTAVTLTEQTFINGSLHAAGTTLQVDLEALGLKSVDDTYVAPKGEDAPKAPLAPNLVKAGKAADPIPYEVAAIAPTGPNPTVAQATPPGAVPDAGGGFVMPASDDGAGGAITPEKTDKGK